MVRLMRWMIGMILASCSTTGIHSTLQAKNKTSKKQYNNGLYDLPPGDPLAINDVSTSIRHLLQVVPSNACTPASIDDFPPDFMNQQQRSRGGILIHILLALYACYGLAAVCDTYFVPSLQLLSERLGISSDVAGATFMAAGTSSPEFFESIIGSFVTEGDIGIGTIVGSAVFNILAVTSFCGLLTGMVVPLDWWPLTRDCVFYAFAVIALVVVIEDEKIYWYESVALLVMFVLYVILMYFNRRLAKFFHSGPCCRPTLEDESKDAEYAAENETMMAKDKDSVAKRTDTDKLRQTAIAIANDAFAVINPHNGTIDKKLENGEIADLDNALLHENETKLSAANETEEEEEEWSPVAFPKKGFFSRLGWLIGWPMNIVFYYTVPNCNKKRWENFYPLTFFMSVLYIGSLSYFVAWMVTIMGYTIGVPDTVMGITFLAIGTSVPEGYSSVIVCRQGLGNMAISNSVGSNIFDILFCLGLPWLIKALAFSEGGYVQINSSGLVYSSMSLLATVVLLYLVIVLFKFQLNYKVGITCLLLYSAFLTFASLVELNVFSVVNPPPCE